MVNPGTTSPLRWRSKHLSESNASVPTSSGVYAIGRLKSLHGLELERVYVYVGETKNLQRRLSEHLPDTEQNPKLRSYLRKHYANVVCWYAPAAPSRVKSLEDDLIREIRPIFNTVGITESEDVKDD